MDGGDLRFPFCSHRFGPEFRSLPSARSALGKSGVGLLRYMHLPASG